MYDNALQEPDEAINAINLCVEPASAVKEIDEAIAAHVTEKNAATGRAGVICVSVKLSA
ncbi:hypothetical protein [Enterobacter cloacae]|uniref:hypothetical protein n=1 Tax=Enterobacter cloacae TaxID=550 RepID=UPI003D6FE128